MLRRTLLKRLGSLVPWMGAWSVFSNRRASAQPESSSKPLFGMGIQVDRCIGCARCMQACKTENEVPTEGFFVRTWVERYVIDLKNRVTVTLLDSSRDHSTEARGEGEILRSFFVPKLCNQCDNPPCVQVCPVEATFSTEDGVVLVDQTRCIGCGYCIQACPYGARYLHPVTKTADKCTFCYHRITRDLLPACVEVCPTGARVFGDINSTASPLVRLRRMSNIHVLKPYLNTAPKVFYTDLDGEVR